jgi:hypothetical protein
MPMAKSFDSVRSSLRVEIDAMRKQIESNDDVVFNYNLDSFIRILENSVDYFDFVRTAGNLYPEFFSPLYKKTLGNMQWMEQHHLFV